MSRPASFFSSALAAACQRASNDPAGMTCPVEPPCGLGIEVPDARMSKPVGVRIAGQNVARDVASQVPLARAVVRR